jgi:hypothetical protein
MKTTLGKVLSRVLARVPVPSGATFMVREDGIEITTTTFMAAECAVDRRKAGNAPSAAAGASGGGLANPGKEPPKNPLSGVEEAAPDEGARNNVAVVSVAVERAPLEEALKQMRSQANINFVLDPGLGEKSRTTVSMTLLNAPVDSAVRVLTEMAELDYVWLDNIFYLTTRDKAQKLRSTWPNRRSGGGALIITGASGAAGGGM